jgi:hypothetical protein
MRKYAQIRCSVNRIGGVMVSVLTSNAIDRGFERRSGQTKDYEIGICCFSDKYAALWRKSKDWLSRNQDDVYEWDCCFSELALYKFGPHHHLIEN